MTPLEIILTILLSITITALLVTWKRQIKTEMMLCCIFVTYMFTTDFRTKDLLPSQSQAKYPDLYKLYMREGFKVGKMFINNDGADMRACIHRCKAFVEQQGGI